MCSFLIVEQLGAEENENEQKGAAYNYFLKTNPPSPHSKRPRKALNYVCEYENCSKSFSEASTLKRHIRTHTGERSFLCSHPGCGRAFNDSTNARRHELTHTNPFPFHCQEEGCCRTFSRASSLKKHLVKYHGREENSKEVIAAAHKSVHLSLSTGGAYSFGFSVSF